MSAAPRGGLAALRPLSLGELLDQAIWLYRQHFWRALAIGLAAQIPYTTFAVISALTHLAPASGTPINNPTPQQILLPYLELYLVWLFMYEAFGLSALVQFYVGALTGQRRPRLASLRRLLANWLRLLLTLVATLVLFLVFTAWAAVPFAGWLTGLGLLFFFIMVVVPLLVPVTVVENPGSLRVLRRTWELARRSFWWAIWAMIVLFLFSQVIVGVPFFVAGAATIVSNNSHPVSGWALSAQQLAMGLIEVSSLALYLPLLAAGLTLIYLQLRVRGEGVDLALASGGALNSAVPAAGPYGLLRAKEIIWFALLSLGAVVFVVLIYGGLLAVVAVLILLGQTWAH